MKYTINTTTLKSALNLIIIRNNISTYYRKSSLLQISVENRLLILSTETYNVCSQVQIQGNVDSEDSISIFVDNLLFQSLVCTISDNVIDLEFVDSGINIHTTSSVLKIPKLVDIDSNNIVLNTPITQIDTNNKVDISADIWKFISHYHAPMLGTSTSFPVYQNIWFNEDGTVVAGNFETEVFTKSIQPASLPKTCLISSTMLNLLTSMPENSNVYYIDIGNDKIKYLIQSESDSYKYYAEFEPLYESDEHVGNYRADALLTVMNSTSNIVIDRTQIIPLLHQMKVFGNTSVKFVFNGIQLCIESQNVNGEITINNPLSQEAIMLEFDVAILLKIFNIFASDQLYVGFSLQSASVVGLNIWDNDLTITIGKK